MVRPLFAWLVALSLVAALASVAEAQRYRRGGNNQGQGGNQGGQAGNDQQDQGKNKSNVPDDPRLLEVHQAFIRGAQKLALEYERKKDLDKAITCYREILRLVPNYGPAQAALTKIIGKQATAKRVVVEVMANKGWQDSGVDVIEGKPVMIRADGHWKMNMHYPVGGDGIEIPKELRKFNLGALIGIIIPPGDQPGAHIEAPPESTEAASGENAGDKPAEAAPAEQAQPAGADAEKPAAGDATKDESAKTKEEEEAEKKKPRPFFIGHQADLFAKISGRLYLRMYDSDTDDNVGKIRVDISGTFGPPAEGSTGGRAK
ncbi:MAG TPA: tetratricopeptide repeat protein [Pirellulales bacterium]